MKIDSINYENNKTTQVNVPDEIFALTPREDIIQRVVKWQLARKQSGTHKTKTRSEVSYSTKKIVRQKGSGGARHGSRGVTQFRHGGTTKGPVVRSHAHKLPKKVRVLGLKHILSDKARLGNIKTFENINLDKISTSKLVERMETSLSNKTLIIHEKDYDQTFLKSASNIKSINLLNVDGINVYDIIRFDTVVLTSGAIDKIKERFND